MALLRLNGSISFLSAHNIVQAIKSKDTNRLVLDASGIGSIDYAGFDSIKKALANKELIVCTTSQETMKIFSGLNPEVRGQIEKVAMSYCTHFR